MKVANSAESLTWEAGLPTSGAKMETRCFDSWYSMSGSCMTKEIIGLRGFQVCVPSVVHTAGGSSW